MLRSAGILLFKIKYRYSVLAVPAHLKHWISSRIMHHSFKPATTSFCPLIYLQSAGSWQLIRTLKHCSYISLVLWLSVFDLTRNRTLETSKVWVKQDSRAALQSSTKHRCWQSFIALVYLLRGSVRTHAIVKQYNNTKSDITRMCSTENPLIKRQKGLGKSYAYLPSLLAGLYVGWDILNHATVKLYLKKQWRRTGYKYISIM